MSLFEQMGFKKITRKQSQHVSDINNDDSSYISVHKSGDKNKKGDVRKALVFVISKTALVSAGWDTTKKIRINIGLNEDAGLIEYDPNGDYALSPSSKLATKFKTKITWHPEICQEPILGKIVMIEPENTGVAKVKLLQFKISKSLFVGQ